MKDQEAADWAANLVATSLVWDAHAGIFPGPDTDLSKVTRWRDCGVDYVSLNIGFDVMPWENAISTVSAYHRVLSKMDGVRLTQTSADIDTARAKGQLAVSFDIEGVNALNGDIGSAINAQCGSVIVPDHLKYSVADEPKHQNKPVTHSEGQ